VNKHKHSDLEQAALFELAKPEVARPVTIPRENPRPFEITGVLVGNSSFTAKGWQGTFYPDGLKPPELLSYYATQFRAVEVDSTFYGIPRPSTVLSWKDKTPSDFVFALKVPQVVTHEKILVGCEPEFDEFVEAVGLLGEKLGPMLFQFPKFDKWMLKDSDQLKLRLDAFLKKVTNRSLRFAVEIRNKNWIDDGLLNLLREHRVALALTDTSFMPRPWEMKPQLDLVTTDFVYVRWLGNRKGIEEMTQQWDKIIVDRERDLTEWVHLLKKIQERKISILAFANNHYAGFGPGTIKLFCELWQKA
jgi:uncharacterized protein YecE (DUF72 family)